MEPLHVLLPFLALLGGDKPEYSVAFLGQDAAPAIVEIGPGAFVWMAADKEQSDGRAGEKRHIVRWTGAPQIVQAAPHQYVWISDDEQDDAPAGKAWIGVRLSPVPAPLAAHIGDRGMMVVNIVKGSPADEAGLQQYDVICRFNGRNVSDSDELVSSISNVGAGHAADVELTRGGKQIRIRITPETASTDGDFEYKFDEPAPVDTDVQLRGHFLRPDAQGNWLLEDLGKLKDLPAPLQDLPLIQPRQYQVPHFNVEPDGTVRNFFRWQTDGGPQLDLPAKLGANARVEMHIVITNDDGTLSVARESDGSVTVTRKDAQGEESTETYDDMESLQAADPEAYEMLQGVHLGGGGAGAILRVEPRINLLPEKRERFQSMIQKRIEKVEAEARRAREEALRLREEINGRVAGKVRTGQDEPRSISKSVTIEDGHIVIEISRDGNTERHEFSSIDELRDARPDLYDDLKDLIEK